MNVRRSCRFDHEDKYPKTTATATHSIMNPATNPALLIVSHSLLGECLIAPATQTTTSSSHGLLKGQGGVGQPATDLCLVFWITFLRKLSPQMFSGFLRPS